MATTGEVSAIVATHNGVSRGYIFRAIESVLRQSVCPIEILVIDDASTDGTADRIHQQFGDRIRVLRLSANVGPSGARNQGIRLVNAPYIAFLDDDDEWLPAKIETQLHFALAIGTRMLLGRAELMNSHGQPLSDRWPAYPEALSWPGILFRNPVHGTGSVLVRREAILEAGGFPERYRMGEDWVLWARIARQERLVFHDEVVARIRVHDRQSAAGKGMTWIREQTLVALRDLVRDLPPKQATLVLNSYAYGGSLRALAAMRLPEANHLAKAASETIDWKLLTGKVLTSGLAKSMPAMQDAVNRWELRRLVRRFLQLD
jgi:glycosyltransferase involved in cell wall biosynthesis